MCVEIDASFSYVHEFDIESTLSTEPIKVRVEYEWKPSRCEKCCIFGHSFPTILVPTPAPTPPFIPMPTPDHNLNKGKTAAIDPAPTLPMIHATDPSSSTSIVHQLLPPLNILSTRTMPASPQPKIPIDHGPLPSSTTPLSTDSSLPPIDLSHAKSPFKHPTIPNDLHSTAQPNLESSHRDADPVALNIPNLQPLDTSNYMESKMASL